MQSVFLEGLKFRKTDIKRGKTEGIKYFKYSINVFYLYFPLFVVYINIVKRALYRLKE